MARAPASSPSDVAAADCRRQHADGAENRHPAVDPRRHGKRAVALLVRQRAQEPLGRISRRDDLLARSLGTDGRLERLTHGEKIGHRLRRLPGLRHDIDECARQIDGLQGRRDLLGIGIVEDEEPRSASRLRRQHVTKWMGQRLDGRDGPERRAADTDQDEILVAGASLGGERLDLGDQRRVGGKIHPTLTASRVLGAEAGMLLGNDRRNLVEHGIGHAVRGPDSGRHGIAIVDREARRLRIAMVVHGHSSSLAGDSSPSAFEAVQGGQRLQHQRAYRRSHRHPGHAIDGHARRLGHHRRDHRHAEDALAGTHAGPGATLDVVDRLRPRAQSRRRSPRAGSPHNGRSNVAPASSIFPSSRISVSHGDSAHSYGCTVTACSAVRLASRHANSGPPAARTAATSSSLARPSDAAAAIPARRPSAITAATLPTPAASPATKSPAIRTLQAVVDEWDQATQLRGERERRAGHRRQGRVGLPADGDGDDVDRIVVLADGQSAHALRAVRAQERRGRDTAPDHLSPGQHDVDRQLLRVRGAADDGEPASRAHPMQIQQDLQSSCAEHPGVV